MSFTSKEFSKNIAIFKVCRSQGIGDQPSNRILPSLLRNIDEQDSDFLAEF